MIKGREIILTIIVAGVSLLTSAQTYPGFSQYLTNGMVINPAYTGSRGTMSTLFSVRQQWMVVDGAPSFQTASIHAPLKNDKVALGLMYSRQTYGITAEHNIYATYAYHIHFAKSKLSFGIQGGADITSLKYEKLVTSGANPADDPAFERDAKDPVLPNVGAGFYFYSRTYFFGASVPAFLSYRSSSASSVYHSVQNYDILFLAGGLISFTENFRFKPSLLLKYSMTQPTEIDVNGNFIISDILWIGASYRIAEESVIGIAELQISPQLKIGYSYDYQLGSIGNFSSGSHEILLRLEFGQRISASSPRFF
jgi:type IX secretion system PorP/SprF family membrane protein